MDFIPVPEDKGMLARILARLLNWFVDKLYVLLGGSKAGTNYVDAPLIASSGLMETTTVLGAAKGKLAGYDYVLLANGNDRVMLNVTLPHNTGLHIIAIGDKSISLARDIHDAQRRWLEPVSLEGNFPDRFEMFVSKDKQTEVRQLFEPDLMWHFYELCRTYDFELFHESLYFSVAEDADDSNDSTTMVADAEAFLDENAAFFNRLGGV
jgi:hypothetical protein